MKKYTYSVITPVYNMEKTLRETIECVINQTIGFEDNIQLILVNDGSSDNSGEICEKYHKRYPNNIVYINKENGGVSKARNAALSHVKGKYTVFLDGDDIWAADAFEKADSFFSKHFDEIDMCSCRIEYMGDFAEKEHPLAFKYQSGSKVVSLAENPSYICTTVGNMVLKSDAIANMSFNETMVYCEDSWFINILLAERMALGIVSDAVFYYRKNRAGNNTSVNIIKQKAWYFDVIDQYYLGLFKHMENKFGYIPAVFQETVFYDLKWRGFNQDGVRILSEEEKREHVRLLTKALEYIDDTIIMGASGVNTYRKIYFLNLKHHKNILQEAKLSNSVYRYKGMPILNLKARQMVIIKALSLDGDVLTISGLLRFNGLQRPYSFYLKESASDEKIIPETTKDKEWDIRGVIGERIVDGEKFRVSIPVKPGSVISFYVDIEGETIKINPQCSERTGITSAYNHSYCNTGGCIIRLSNGRLYINNNSFLKRMYSEKLFLSSVEKKSGNAKRNEMAAIIMEDRKSRRASLQDKVAFISVRAEDTLLGNMESVYEALELPKEKYAKLRLGKRNKELGEAKKIMSTSRIVITDDYLVLMKEKKENQRYIQLWHATGGGKHFGQDGSTMFLVEDAQFHRNYDLVTVSSEYVREVYASAFAIPMEKIIATGVARTDIFFDSEHIKKAIEKVYEKHPELKNREVILYTPTFRDIPGRDRGLFKPELEFDALSANLAENQIFVIKPHPVMVAPIIEKKYDNIVEVRDVDTNDLMFVSDMMITDYSSTMFEYSLLKKPMAFFCYDYDDYDRDFYIDFDKELPGPVLRNQEELVNYLKNKDHPLAQDYDSFYQKYMGACDGHSTERIIGLIEDMYYGKDK